MSNPTHALWVDLESTDSDPYSDHAAILEVGAIITLFDPDLTEVARASMIIRPPGAQPEHDAIWQRMVPVVRQMHTDNGLWLEATTGETAWNIIEADQALRQWVHTHTGGTPVPLAGSGVAHLDRPFVMAHLPHLSTQLTYWHLDIGNVRRLLQLAGRDEHVDLATDVAAKPHRGLADVELHVAEARRYLQLLGSIPTAER